MKFSGWVTELGDRLNDIRDIDYNKDILTVCTRKDLNDNYAVE